MKRTIKFQFVLFLSGLAASTTAIASSMSHPSELTRHHIQNLIDAGFIDTLASTWPLPWAEVQRALDEVEASQLDERASFSYHYLRKTLRAKRQTVTTSYFAHAATSHPGLIDFSSSSRERLEARAAVAYKRDSWAFKLQATAVGDAIDDQDFRLDGSYLAGHWGNWAIGLGAVDRWWGPGWQSSLILGNAARPSPGVFVDRIEQHRFELPILRWFGPWDMSIFANQLESNRGTPNAKLLGMRVAFRPWQPLEIGLSRTAQWGGEGRPQDWRSFRKMLVGESNRGADGLAEDGSDEPANQLAGYDWRLGHNFGRLTAAFYGQLIGEDEAGGMPYKYLGMAGVEASGMLGAIHSRLALEVSNTTMEFNKGGTPNVAYEHPRYPSGYRYHGRPLGASTDNDTELVVLKGLHHFGSGQHVNWTIGKGRINSDGRNTDLPGGGNVLADSAVNLWYASAEVSIPILTSSAVNLGGRHYSDPLEIRGQNINSALYVSFQYNR